MYTRSAVLAPPTYVGLGRFQYGQVWYLISVTAIGTTRYGLGPIGVCGTHMTKPPFRGVMPRHRKFGQFIRISNALWTVFFRKEQQ